MVTLNRGHRPPKMNKMIFSLQVALALIVSVVSATSLVQLYNAGIFPHNQSAILCADVAMTNAKLAAMLARISGLESKVKARIAEEKSDVEDAIVLSEMLVWMEEVKHEGEFCIGCYAPFRYKNGLVFFFTLSEEL